MIASVVALSLAASGDLDMELVQAAATLLARGQSPYALEGVKPRPMEEVEDLPSLVGCSPVVASGSSRGSVQIDYTCTSDDGPYVHRVSFNQRDNGSMSIYVDPLGTALGPTKAAISAEKLPGMSRQATKLARAARFGGDVTLDGIIPLTSAQITELTALSHCTWDEPRSFGRRRKEWFTFVTCPEFERNKGRMIEIDFDDEKRAVTVRIAHGAKIRRGG